MKWTNEQAAAYLAGLIDGEGCISLCTLKNGSQAGTRRRVVTIGMTDKEIIDLAARLLAQLGIGFARCDRFPGGTRKHVWTISIQARSDLIKIAELIPVQHAGKRERLDAILSSYLTAKVYARRADHKSPAAIADLEPYPEE